MAPSDPAELSGTMTDEHDGHRLMLSLPRTDYSQTVFLRQLRCADGGEA
jgi:hypothetical protein